MKSENRKLRAKREISKL